ncbi:hypothetical protein HPB52_007395 [Rhipicephalus sanguineus]|uniref:Uncharacterized protein n=1 Tax=Rhipicephalus sanguineus TaxID=34632 RepID=A0A9D4QCT5_RHISA|nr:hypothetical protein HPB52_007395 [Rhipicephalus sanguineus]
MLIATILSTLVIVAAINYFCRKLNGKPLGDHHDQGVWTVARARSSSSVKPTTTTYTVTSALCSVPEEVLKTWMAAAAPRMATGDVEPVPPRVPDRPVFDDKADGKQDPEVLSQGEGLQQQPNRGMPPTRTMESLQKFAFDSNLASLDTAKHKVTTAYRRQGLPASTLEHFLYPSRPHLPALRSLAEFLEETGIAAYR